MSSYVSKTMTDEARGKKWQCNEGYTIGLTICFPGESVIYMGYGNGISEVILNAASNEYINLNIGGH